MTTARGTLRLDAALEEIRASDRYRTLEPRPVHAEMIDFCSNDYLGLAVHPEVTAALRAATRAGSGGSRLLAGGHREHLLLEEELAEWVRRERALIFSSGYHAAIGAIPVLGDLLGSIASDERNHASLIDGIRLSRARCSIYPHREPPYLRTHNRGTLVVTESLFSMDGDAIDLATILAKLDGDDLLLVDEAHALGVAGVNGAGLAYGLDDDRIVVLGTFSKALGTHGGFIAGSAAVIDLLVNRARSFIFDTALPPALIDATRRALHLAQRADDRRDRLHENAKQLRDGLGGVASAGGGAGFEYSPVVAVVLGSEQRSLDAAHALWERGIVAPAIRPPTVPVGSSRLRLSVRSEHRSVEIERAVQTVNQCIATL